jgi:Uma2 family endonuclease
MVVSINELQTKIEYPDEDGKPMAEGDAQRKSLTYCTTALGIYFRERSDVYVAGNLFIYYEQGNPEAVVAPDTFVVIGVNSDNRRSYKTWEEGDKTPDFVLEITSKSTRSNDQGAKKGIYAFLGVREYFQYDPTGDYLVPQLQGLRLDEGNYYPIASSVIESDFTSIHSEILGLDLRVNLSGELRFYDPAAGQKLMAHEELDQALREAEERANQEAEARQEMAARLAEMEARLQDLQGDTP